MFEGIITGISSLVIIALVLYAAYLASKFVGQSGAGRLHMGKGKYIKIIDRVAFAQDKSIAVVKVADQTFLIGITGTQISMLKELDDLIIEEETEVTTVDKFDFQAIIEKIRKRDGSK